MLKKRFRTVINLIVIALLLTTTIGMSTIASIGNGTVSDLDSDLIDSTPVSGALGDLNDVPHDFDGNLTENPTGDATPYGDPYGIGYDWPVGPWEDAEKSMWDGDDDLMCWAGSAANILKFTRWHYGTADAAFDYFQDHWTDEGGLAIFGWEWWFDGTNQKQGVAGWSQVNVAGGAFWTQYNFDDYYRRYPYWATDPYSLVMAKIDKYLHDGYGVSIGIDGPGGHALTCWGFTSTSSDPDYYTGIFVTDSDDTKNDFFGDLIHRDRLRYYRVKKSTANNYWYLQDYGGSNAWYIDLVMGLAVGPGIAPRVNAGPDQTTYVGTTVSFSGSFKNPAPSHTYKWDFGDGTTRTGTLNPSHVYGANGVYTVKLEVTDPQGDVGSDTLKVIVNNVAPVVNAGLDRTCLEGQSITFSGTFSDPGSVSHTIKWSFGDGTYAYNTLTPNKVFKDNGVYTVTLEVRDDQGAVGYDTLYVTVSNVAPSVNAGPDQTTDEGDIVTFLGSHYDPGASDTHTYSWDFGDGSPNVGGTSVTHVYADNGVYTVTLTVTDDDGGVGSDTLTVTVNNVAPTVNAGSDQIGDEGSVISFTGTHFDPGILDTHTYDWNFGDGSPTVSGTTASHIYADNDVYTVTLTVTDNDGGVGTDTLTVTINNVAPTANAGIDQIVDEGDLVVFLGSHTDPGSADTHIYSWNFGDGSPTAIGTSVTHPYADNGIYTVTLTVEDDDGGVGSDTLEVMVHNVAPIVSIESVEQPQLFDLEDLIVIMLETVYFEGTAHDPGSDDLTFTWDVGDGSAWTTTSYLNDPPSFPVDILESLEHTYSNPGEYTVTLTVEDDDGGIGVDTLILTVWGPQDLKADAILDLDLSKVGSKHIDRSIDHIIKFIERSLREKYWKDATHLDPKHGTSVFCYETVATLRIEKYDSYIYYLEKTIARWEAKGKDTSWLKIKLATVLNAQSTFKSVVYQLVKADELIVRVAISEAENTAVKLLKFQGKVDKELAKANEYFQKAMEKIEDEDYSKAIRYFCKAWDHAQKAIKFANKEYKCFCWHHHKHHHKHKHWQC